MNSQTRQLMDTVAVEAGKGPFDHHKYMTQLILQIVCGTYVVIFLFYLSILENKSLVIKTEVKIEYHLK